MESFVVNQKLQRVSVSGNVDAQDVLDEVSGESENLTLLTKLVFKSVKRPH
jgi:hypothetical protein